MAKVIASAPGHITTLHRIVFDSLTQAKSGQLREIGPPYQTAP